jgi:hypothetical protein
MPSIHSTTLVFANEEVLLFEHLLLNLICYSLEGGCVPSAAMYVELPCFFFVTQLYPK